MDEEDGSCNLRFLGSESPWSLEVKPRKYNEYIKNQTFLTHNAYHVLHGYVWCLGLLLQIEKDLINVAKKGTPSSRTSVTPPSARKIVFHKFKSNLDPHLCAPLHVHKGIGSLNLLLQLCALLASLLLREDGLDGLDKLQVLAGNV